MQLCLCEYFSWIVLLLVDAKFKGVMNFALMHLHNRVHRGFCQMHALPKFRLRSPQLLCAKSKLQKYKFQIEEIQITIYITRCIVASARCRHSQSSFSEQMVPSNPSEYKLQINHELQLNYKWITNKSWIQIRGTGSSSFAESKLAMQKHFTKVHW